MAPVAERNPFRPGPGTWPPVLAGRDDERAALQRIAEDLLAHRADPIHLMEAPRGMGKTVLLLYLERSAPSGLTVVRTSAADLPDVEALARKLATPKEGLRRLVGQVVGVSVAGLSLEREAAGGRTGRGIEDALRSREEPLLLAIDEGHALAPEVAHVILNAMQGAAGTDGSSLGQPTESSDRHGQPEPRDLRRGREHGRRANRPNDHGGLRLSHPKRRHVASRDAIAGRLRERAPTLALACRPLSGPNLARGTHG